MSIFQSMNSTTSRGNKRNKLGTRMAFVAVALGALAGACGQDADELEPDAVASDVAVSKTKLQSAEPLAIVLGANVVDRLSGATTSLVNITSNNASDYTLPKGPGTSLGWPNVHDDLGTDQAVITWQLLGDTNHSISQLYQLVAANNGIQLSVNGERLRRGAPGVAGVDYSVTLGAAPNCPTGGVCFTTTIHHEGWPKQNLWWDNIKTFELVFGDWDNDLPVVVYVVPMAYPASYFLSQMEPTFKHIRCGMCHSLISEGNVITQHQNVGGFDPANVTKENSPNFPGDRITCAGTNGCHSQQIDPVPGVIFTDTAWMTPASNMGIDWFTMTGEQICQKVVSNLPTEQELTLHFHEDGRQGWATHSGEMPGGAFLQTAPPNDFFDWLDIVDPWIAAGAPCPPGTPPPDQIAYATGCSALHQPYSVEWWDCMDGA